MPLGAHLSQVHISYTPRSQDLSRGSSYLSDSGSSDAMASSYLHVSSSLDSGPSTPTLEPHGHGSSMAFPSSAGSSSSSAAAGSTSSASPVASSAAAVSAAILKKRQKQQRRLLNRLAVYLPQPLKPIASSSSRFFGTLAGSLVIIMLCVHLLASQSPPQQVASSAADLPRVVDNRVDNDIDDARQQSQQHKRDQAPLHGGGLAAGAAAARRAQNGVDEGDHRKHYHDRDAAAIDPHGAHARAESLEGQTPHQQSTVVQVKEVDKCGTRGCNTCGSRGCDPEGYLRGFETVKSMEPKPKFRDNLRKDMKYITWGQMNGYSNQFLAQVNGIYLSKLSDRVPILPPFAASQHMDRHAAGYLSFDKVFDVPRLQSLLRHPMVNWEDIKLGAEQNPALFQPPNPEFADEKIRARAAKEVQKEKISCWSLWAAQMPSPGKPAGSAVQNHLGLDVEYWQAPLHYAKPPHDRHMRYWDLVLLDKNVDNARTKQLASVAKVKRQAIEEKKAGDKTPVTNRELPHPPDDQLLCFDTVYYTAATSPQEWWQPHAPVWKAVGRYARWNPEVTKLADSYIRDALAIEDGVRTPDFVSVHIRRGDFKKWCKDTPLENCMASLEAYKRAVTRVRDDLLEARGVYARWVIVTTDETDEQYFAAIEKLGWRVIDHAELRTAEKHGLWWEIVLDAAIQSKGSAFVGTDRSMMSLLAAKRVEEWNHGPTELVKWGVGVKSA